MRRAATRVVLPGLRFVSASLGILIGILVLYPLWRLFSLAARPRSRSSGPDLDFDESTGALEPAESHLDGPPNLSEGVRRSRWARNLVRLLVFALLIALLPLGLLGAPTALADTCAVTLVPTGVSNTVGDNHTVTATVLHGELLEVGATVTFTASGTDGEDPTFATATTNSSGQATFTFTSTKTGTSDITADAECTDGDTGSDSATKEWTAGEPATVTVIPTSATNTVDDEHTVTATVVDQFGNPVPGVTVTFTAAGTNAENPSSATPTTDSQGQAAFTFTSTLIGTSTVTATAGEGVFATATKNWIAGAAATITLEPDGVSNPAGQTHTVTATVVDQFGNPVPGAEVFFEAAGTEAEDPPSGSGTTDESGQATFSFTSTLIGTSTVTATTNGIFATATKVWTHATPTTITLEPDGVFNVVDTTHTVTATVVDAFGNPVADQLVNFEAAGTTAEDPPSGSGTTDESGQAPFEFTSTLIGQSVITATANGLTATATKNWVAATPTTITLEPGFDENPVGQPHTVTATVFDEFGNPVPGANVGFEAAGTEAEGPPNGTGITNDDGQATFTFTSTKIGTSTVTATTNGIFATATKVWTAGPATGVILEPETDTNVVGTTHTVTATLIDEFDNESPNAGHPVIFLVEGTGAEEPSEEITETNADGQATFTFTSTKTGTSEIEVIAFLLPGHARDFATKVWTAGPPDSLTLEPEEDTNPPNSPHTVTATVEDGFGNRVPGAVVTFTAAGTMAEQPDSATATTNDDGQANFTFTSTEEGVSTITATVDSLVATATKTWVLGPPDQVSVIPTFDQNVVNTLHTVTATVQDAGGNALEGVVVTFTVGGTGGESPDSATDTTNSEGQANFTFTSSLPGDSTINAQAGDASGQAVKRWVAVVTPTPPTPPPPDGSGPDAASWASNRIDVVVRGTDDAIWHRWWDGTAWHGFESLGGVATSDPATVSWSFDRLDIFVRGTDNALWHRWYENGIWYGWESLGGVLTSSPDVSSWGPNRLDVFVRGTDNQLWQRWWDGTAWHGWAPLGGVLTSGPSAVSWDTNRIDVFVRGTDNAMWHRWWDGTAWHGYESLGGVLTSDPDAASWGPNRLDVFARGTDNQLWQRWWDGTAWHGWAPLGGVLTSPPGAVSWGFNRIDVFVRGTDMALWHRWWDGTAWQGYESLGGVLK